MGLFSQWFHKGLERSLEHAWLLLVCLIVVITGTIWGFVDWMRTRTHKRKSQTDPAYVDQTEAPPAGGIIAFWVGIIFTVGCAIAFALFILVLFWYFSMHYTACLTKKGAKGH